MTASGARTKVHRRAVVLDGTQYTVLTPRPGTTERFATNRYHGTWHILSDVGGARLLGRLMWAMAFQRHADTILLLDGPLLVENPFDADPSSPIVIVNTALGVLRQGAVGALQAQLPLRGSPDGTVVLQTPGLDLALTDDARGKGQQAWWRARADRRRILIDRSRRTLVLAAPPSVLRSWGLELSYLGDSSYRGMDYAELDWPSSEGEVQIFDDFERRVVRARAARSRLFPGRAHQELSDDERAAVWRLTASEVRLPPGTVARPPVDD